MTTPRRRVAALLALAAGGDAAWTVGCPHTAAAAATSLPAQPRLRLLRRACSAWSLLPTARQRPRACTARPASSRASACATAGALAHLSRRARPALRRCQRRMGGHACSPRPALLSAQDTVTGPRPVRLQAQVRQPLDELVWPLVQERSRGQGVGVPLQDVRDRHAPHRQKSSRHARDTRRCLGSGRRLGQAGGLAASAWSAAAHPLPQRPNRLPRAAERSAHAASERGQAWARLRGCGAHSGACPLPPPMPPPIRPCRHGGQARPG